MAELCAEKAESAPAEGRGAAAGTDPGRRKATAHEAHRAQTFAATSAAAATPIADMVEAAVDYETTGRLCAAGGARRGTFRVPR
jgi:hypothetical protein